MTMATKQHLLSPDIKAFIMESINDVLEDPDFGLELTEGFKKKLQVAKRSKVRTISLEEVRKKYY
ncbi:hypothetical protein A2118_01875 [Candidatus Kaiserbacteria bacterium GWA2_50_9]|uniref:Uncharacterized protein n=1 Tax=Candidatus Kaiserbacteria bacterium GWA2_50_9 TaxID=1798474 RepID=A0A1F6BVQ6_9BACT|nr:MAG: hypothetical protein A2118_01875 [Candidatus Kaiserbacteria bacterium GWA2_50_9]